MSDDDTQVNVEGLDKLLKALKGKQPEGRIGILGQRAARGTGGPNNAEVGAFHEFGTSRHPVRSFLRLPLTALLNKTLESSGAFTEDTLKEVVKSGNLKAWLQKVLVAAEAVVLGGFDSAGYGTWPPSDMRRKENHQTLVESTQLRNSITTDIIE